MLVAVLEVELELQQVAQPGDLGPELPDRISTGRISTGRISGGLRGPEHGELAQRRIEQEVNQRVPVEGRGQLVFGPDQPDRLAPVRGAADKPARHQRIQCRPDRFRRGQRPCAGRPGDTAAFQVVQPVTQSQPDLPERQGGSLHGQQNRSDQGRRGDRHALVDAPGHLEGGLMQRQPPGRRVSGDRPARGAEEHAQQDGLTEPHVDLAVVPGALRLDEAVEPAEPLGLLLPAAGVVGVLGDLVQLVEADRDRQQRDVVHPALQVGVGRVGQQAQPRRQHLPGP